MLNVGDRLPDFTAVQQEGKVVTDKDFAGKKLVLFFYPQAGTPTCTTEVCNLRDNYESLQASGYEVIGVSADTVNKLKNFHEKYSLPFDLIADTQHDLISKLGVWQQKTTFGKTYMGIVRTTFMFDENGICTRIIDKVQSKRAAGQILES